MLREEYDVLLLDEPTNDLDFAALEWLERQLASQPGSLVVVSHDRAFLDRTVTRIVELDEWTRGATEYAGGWSEYEAERERRRERHFQRWDASVDRAQAHRGAAAPHGRVGAPRLRPGPQEEEVEGREADVRGEAQEGRDGREAVRAVGAPPRSRARRAQRRRRRAARSARSSSAARSGSARSISRSAGATGSRSRARTAAARRRCSTRCLGRLPLVAGTRWQGPGVVLGELEQDRAALSGDSPLLDVFRDFDTETARTLLAKFGLGAADVLRAASSLSPGERTRAGLALLAARGVNCLVLDEPTNHLDVEAIEELERALAGYDGTVLLVTHDRRFLDAFEPTRTIEL